MGYPMQKYINEQCDTCLRRRLCYPTRPTVGKVGDGRPEYLSGHGPTMLDLVMCAVNKFYKGLGDEALLTDEERTKLEQDPKIIGGG